MDLRVPMEGKYIPTQASNAKKEAIRAANGTKADIPAAAAAAVRVLVDAAAAPPMASTAARSMEDVELSVETPLLAHRPNTVEPRRQEAMKQENTAP